MNQAIRPVVYAISLYLVSGGGFLLTGCASQQAKPIAETSSTPAEPEPTIATTPTETAKPEPYEYKAIPFEEVLKQEEEAASRQKATKPALPTGEDAPKFKPSTPLRPPQETPPVEPEKPVVESKANNVVAKPEDKPIQPDNLVPEEAKPVPAPLPVPTTVEFTLDQLPITIGNNWVLSSNQDTCSLQTVPVTMEDGTGKTPLSLRLSKDAWLVDTKSDIDMTYPDTGLFLSNGVHIPLESIVKDTKISISKQKQQLTNALKASDSVRVALGFWPTWPMTETQSKTISVANFPQALAAWETCNQKISAR